MKALDGKPAITAKAAAIVLATWAIYNQDLTIIANEALRSELMSHILALPPLFIYLLYRKRKMLGATIPFEKKRKGKRETQTSEATGGLLCLLAFLLYWHGSYTFNPLEFHVVSLPIFAAGLILATFNIETLKALSFPLFFLLFLVPMPLELVQAAGTNLSTASSQTAYTILRSLGVSVELNSMYETPVITLMGKEGAPISFAVDIACSDLYELTGFALFAVFISYIARGALWKKATIFIVGFPLMYTLNIARIVSVILISAQVGMETAMQAFHLLGGWILIFIGTSILLSISEKLFKIQLFTRKPEDMACTYCNPKPKSEESFCIACGRRLNPPNINMTKRDIAKIALIAFATILIINLQAPIFALTEGPAKVNIQTLGGEQPPAEILPEIPGYETRFVYRDRRFEEIAKQDAALIYAYVPSGNPTSRLWVTLEVSKTRSSLHSWEVCLITWPQTHGYQPRVTQITLGDAQILDNPPLTTRLFAFQDRNSKVTQVVLYWYENAYFNTGHNLEMEYVKISLVAFANKPEDIPYVENELLSFAKPIANYWQPIKTWSEISLFLSQNSTIMLAATTTLISTIMAHSLIDSSLKKRSNHRIYSKLALEEEKLFIDAVHQSEKEKATAAKISQNYQKLGGKPIGLELMIRKLERTREAGLIKQAITSVNDEPRLTWKTEVPL